MIAYCYIRKKLELREDYSMQMYAPSSPVVANADVRLMMLLQQEQLKMQKRRMKRSHEMFEDNNYKRVKYSFHNSETRNTYPSIVPAIGTMNSTTNNNGNNINNISHDRMNLHNTVQTHGLRPEMSGSHNPDSDSEPYAEIEEYMVKGYCLDETVAGTQNITINEPSIMTDMMDMD